jgi:hypothetical protein
MRPLIAIGVWAVETDASRPADPERGGRPSAIAFRHLLQRVCALKRSS